MNFSSKVAFERGSAWQENVFHFIRVLPPWLLFVVLLFFHWGGKEKKKNQRIVLFLRWVFNWRAGHYLELCECFFLVQEFLWLIWLYFFPLCGRTWGDSVQAVFCQQLFVWFFSPSFKDFQPASEPLSYAARSSLVPERPWTLLSMCPCKAVSAHANYLREGSAHVLQLSEFRIHQNNINLVFARLDMMFWRNFKGFLADFYISGMWE